METRTVTPIATSLPHHRLLEVLAAARGKLAPRASLTMLEQTVARGQMPPLHLHQEPEAFRVDAGTLLFFAGGTCVRLQAGSSAVVAAGVPHTHRAESERARYVVASFVRSPGDYERFLQAVGGLGRGDAEPDEGDRVVELLAAENGITVLGPPGAVPHADLAA